MLLGELYPPDPAAHGERPGVLDEGVFLLGYPFECIGDPGVRDEVAQRVLEALVPDYVPPEGGDTGSPGDDRVRLSDLASCGCASGPAERNEWSG